MLVSVLGLAAVACGTSATTGTPTPTPAPTATASATPTASNHAPAASACQANPDPATPAQVVITQPVAYAQVSGSTLLVAGSINAFEATFQISVKDASGTDIVSQTAHSQTGQTLSPFSATVPATVSASTPACLWVFQFSANTGNPSMIQQVPITLIP
jgi:hypothetical protein